MSEFLNADGTFTEVVEEAYRDCYIKSHYADWYYVNQHGMVKTIEAKDVPKAVLMAQLLLE